MKQVHRLVKSRIRLLHTLRDMFVFFAVVHIFLAFLLAVKHGDVSYMNVFYIESASEFFPGIEKGLGNLILSTMIIAIVYLFFYLRRRNKS